MNRGDQYIEPDNSFYRPSRDPNETTMMMVVTLTVLFVILTAILAAVYFRKTTSTETLASINSGRSIYISVASPTPSPIPPMTPNQNPVLYPGLAAVRMDPEAKVESDAVPAKRGISEQVFVNKKIVDAKTGYARTNPIFFKDPVDFGAVPGIFTFRGNNFRNCASFGYTSVVAGTLNQKWEYNKLGKRLASTQSFEWQGVRWTGQPLVVEWPDGLRAVMNMYNSAKQQAALAEVIIASLDGKVYFLNLTTGEPTRKPIDVGASIKGTPALDPRGYPLLYVGQTDNNGGNTFGMYIYSLIDGSLLWSYDGSEDGAYRSNWSAFDSSPIVSGETDTLIWPCENGLIYTFDLHTSYSAGSSVISVAPEVTHYKYIFTDNTTSHMGVESSIACYGNYGYFVDNTKNLCCLDLNTLKMVWTRVLGDDSDVTPVIDEQDGVPYVYIGTEVDNQGGTGKYSGAGYIYKINGLTGKVEWQSSEPCYTFNGETSETDQSGGCFGNPIVGKKSISNLVIFSFSMTNDLAAGNKLIAYDKMLGTKVWEYNMNIYSYSSPVDFYDSDGNAYIVICDSIGQVHLVNAQTGERIKYIQTAKNIGTPEKTSSGINIEASPVVYNGMMVVGTTTGSIFGITIE